MTVGVYLLACSVTDKLYVGGSRAAERRIRGHLGMLRRKQHPNWKLTVDAAKFGVNSFYGFVLVKCELEDLILTEQFWLDELQTVDSGYNVMRTATESNSRSRRGYHHSPQTIQKIKEARAKQVITSEHRDAISRAQRGKIVSEATRAKHRKRMLGTKLSNETRAKLSENWARKRMNDEH